MHTSEQDVVVIHRYGADHPEVYGDVRWNGPRLVVSFTADLDEHLERLRALVKDPTLIDVDPARYTGAYLTEVFDTIRAQYEDDPRQVWWTMSTGHVTLRAPFDDVAADLHSRYGDALDITLGTKAYPPERIAPREPTPLPTSTVVLARARHRVRRWRPTISTGNDLQGDAVITNRGDRRLRFVTGRVMTAGVRRPGESHLARTFCGAITQAGRTVDLRPGQSDKLRLIVGTTSCLPDRSYTIPPGSYEIVATLSLHFVFQGGQLTGYQTLVRHGPTIMVTAPVC